MAIHEIKNNLYLVDLDQDLPGFRQFISTWIYSSNNKTIVIDPGPASTIKVLRQALKELNISKIDYILLTHIHIDHAGGTGLLLDDFPHAKVVCHPIGMPHLMDPQRLWQGSLKVLGNVAKAYGPIAAIPREKLIYPEKITDEDLSVAIYPTPGHASHHVNYLVDQILFAGEVGGVHVKWNNDFYLRVATPPQFIFEVYKGSLFKMADVPCEKICFGHYGHTNHPDTFFSRAKQQLNLWMYICQEMVANKQFDEKQIFNALLERDPSLQYFSEFDPDIQEREEYFSLNSIKGMIEYLKTV